MRIRQSDCKAFETLGHTLDANFGKPNQSTTMIIRIFFGYNQTLAFESFQPPQGRCWSYAGANTGAFDADELLLPMVNIKIGHDVPTKFTEDAGIPDEFCSRTPIRPVGSLTCAMR